MELNTKGLDELLSPETGSDQPQNVKSESDVEKEISSSSLGQHSKEQPIKELQG